jgi:hypothetical protein
MKNANAFLTSSTESANKSEELAARLRRRIIDLARRSGKVGLSINEAEEQIDDHKGHSVSPRFAGLVKQGVLVRLLIGRGKPTRRFPNGVPRYVTRYDQKTRRNVNVHWVPEFAPASSGECCHPEQSALRNADSDATTMGSREIEGVLV